MITTLADASEATFWQGDFVITEEVRTGIQNKIHGHELVQGETHKQ